MRVLLVLVAGTFCFDEPGAQIRPRARSISPTFDVELISKQREYQTGEQWVIEVKATATAPVIEPLTIRAWSHFFGEYDVIPDKHVPIGDANLSDVLATGGQIWRDGVPVVLWNVPDPKVFGKSSETKVPAGTSVSVNFNHLFGGALKAGRFRQKIWFAIVIEPSPNRFMLLFSRQPIDVEFVVQGPDVDIETQGKYLKEWYKHNEGKLHNRHSILSGNK